jgi:hypothetical protein
MLGIYKRKIEDSKVYYANAKEYTFCCKRLGADGKPQQQTHPVTGIPLSHADGAPVYHEHILSFTRWADRFTEDGYWSVYETSSSTPPEVAEKLEEMAQARSNPTVITEEEFLKRFHPMVQEEKKEVKKLTKRLKQQQEEIERLKLSRK